MKDTENAINGRDLSRLYLADMKEGVQKFTSDVECSSTPWSDIYQVVTATGKYPYFKLSFLWLILGGIYEQYMLNNSYRDHNK